MKLMRFMSILGAAGMTLSSNSQAGLLSGPTSNPTGPDFSSGDIVINYVAGSDTFTITGNTASFVDPYSGGTHQNVTGSGGTGAGTFSLTATINSSGVLSAGSFSIAGEIPSMGINTVQTLLTGSLVTGAGQSAYAWSTPTGATEQFGFGINNMTGNSTLLNDYKKFGSLGAITLTAKSSTFNGSFSGNFHSGGTAGTADTYMQEIPEPAYYPLCAFALAALAYSLPHINLSIRKLRTSSVSI